MTEHANSEAQAENGESADEVICIRSFHASEALKHEIRRIIAEYQAQGWEMAGIYVEGEQVHLKFKRS